MADRDLPELRRVAEELRVQAEERLALGEEPPTIRAAYAASLDLADAHLAAGQPVRAAGAFEQAMRLATHRVLHFDRDSSPLAEDPRGWTRPLAESPTAIRLRGPRGRDRRPTRRWRTGRTPTRVFACTWHNDNFLGPILEHWDARTRTELRFERFSGVPELASAPGRLPRAILTQGSLIDTAEAIFRPRLEWADVIFVDWCNVLPGVLTLVDPRSTRVILRIHSFEVFSKWPHLVDFSRIDDVVFVSEHLRDLALAAIPGLRESDPSIHVLPNAMDLRRFVRPKPPEARFVIGLVGASSLVKDPRWAIEVVRVLRRHDPRYRLHLIGKPFAAEDSAATRAYAAALERDLADLTPAGAVVDVGFTEDLPAALEDVGVVLSSSLRESFHVGLAEGAASGAVPVVRDWPFFPGAAAKVFDPAWTVATPESAAARILAATADESAWRAAGAAASAAVLERYDWEQVRAGYDRLLDSPTSRA